MNPRWLAVPVATRVAACTSVASLAGASAPASPRCPQPDDVILIIGAHRDAPAPSVTPSKDPRVACLVTAAIRDKKPVSIVVASGRPELIRLALGHGTGSLAQQNSPWPSQDLHKVEAAVAHARPESAGADDLAALVVAADAAITAGAPHACLILLDSGLDDRGVLNFTVPGVMAAAPSEVVGQLRAEGDLPSLHGFTVVLAGLGYTSPPEALPSAK